MAAVAVAAKPAVAAVPAVKPGAAVATNLSAAAVAAGAVPVVPAAAVAAPVAAAPAVAVAAVPAATAVKAAVAAPVAATPTAAAAAAPAVAKTSAAPTVAVAPAAPPAPVPAAKAVAVEPSPGPAVSSTAPAPVYSKASTAELVTAVEKGDIEQISSLLMENADPKEGLAHAFGRRNIAAILTIAPYCADDAGEMAKMSADKLLALADQGDWTSVAFALAADADSLPSRAWARDKVARRKLQRAMGVVKARLPRDLTAPTSKPGRGCGAAVKDSSALGPYGLASDILVEQPRWLLPRPRPDELFLDGTDNKKKLEEGWYRVAQHPVSDDPCDAVLWRQSGSGGQRGLEVAAVLHEAGETLLCKAIKAGRWELVEWLLQQPEAGEDLSEQPEREFSELWDEREKAPLLPISLRTAVLLSYADLDDLAAPEHGCLSDDGVVAREWRHGGLAIPVRSLLKWPPLPMLREAISLGPVGLEALRRYCNGAAIVSFAVRPSREIAEKWRRDLAAVGEESFARPLLHRAILAGRTNLVQYLIKESVNVDATDNSGLTALAVAATEKQWSSVDSLLEAGCRADDRSGIVVRAALERASRLPPGKREEQLTTAETEVRAHASALLEKLASQRERAPTASLTDYFGRQTQGEIVQGREPRQFELMDGSLRPKKGDGTGPIVYSRVVLVDAAAERLDVFFVELMPDAYKDVTESLALNIAGKRLLRERELRAMEAVAVAVPPNKLMPGPSGSMQIRPAGAGAFAASLPIVARAPPTGELRVTSKIACCQIAVGRLDVRVDSRRVGETPNLVDADCCEVEIPVPLRPIDVTLEFSGRRVLHEKVEPEEDVPALLDAEIPLAIYVYTTLVDADQGLEFVSVCGHKRDLPDDPPAKPFIGRVKWESGEAHMTRLEPLVLGGAECHSQLGSLKLFPDLPPGREFESCVDFEEHHSETSLCQFKRLLDNPVRVGKIFRPES
eukprot:TRINITY_DN20486_c0_g1_i1.p1 TRINITY_DN20486_c0_g1~~TRINITY_DN20486_c0_g1_i1.p1  ORF type:complete len:965 (+),score=215.81 TRINITY_DN20486_c0_g1_i1:53-2947(+)